MAAARRTIIYVGGFALPDRNAAAQRVLNNARLFRSLGFRMILIGVSHDRPYDGTLSLADSAGAEVEAWETGYPSGGRQWLDAILSDAPVRRLIKEGRVRTDEVAAVICYNHPAIAQARIARLARGWGAKALADCTEWYATRGWTSVPNIVKTIDIALRMRGVNRAMDGLITTSPYISDFYRKTGLPILELPTLIEPGVAGLAPAPFVRASGDPTPLFAIGPSIADDIPRDLIHDRIDWIIGLLARVARLGGRFRLTVVGIERDRFTALFPEQQSALAELGDAVDFLGRVPRGRVLELQATSAYSLVMRQENRVTLAGFPTKYSESISCGTPVIANDMPSIRRYHREGLTGMLIDPATPEEAARTILKAISVDDEAVGSMKRYCRESGLFAPETFRQEADGYFAELGVK